MYLCCCAFVCTPSCYICVCMCMCVHTCQHILPYFKAILQHPQPCVWCVRVCLCVEVEGKCLTTIPFDVNSQNSAFGKSLSKLSNIMSHLTFKCLTFHLLLDYCLTPVSISTGSEVFPPLPTAEDGLPRHWLLPPISFPAQSHTL